MGMPASLDADVPFTNLLDSQAHIVGLESKAPSYQSIFDATSDGLIIINRETGCLVNVNPAACAIYGYAREELLGLPMARLLPPDSQSAFSHDPQTIDPNQTIDASLMHVRKDGSRFPVEVLWTSFTNDDQIYLLGTVRDVSVRIKAEQLLKRQVEAHAHEQATLLEISQTLAFSLELKPEVILERLGVLFDYTHAGLYILEDATLVALAVRGSPLLESAMPVDIPCDDPRALASLLTGQQPNRIADVWSDDPVAQALRALLNRHGALLLEGIHAWLWAPLTTQGRVIGALCAAHTEPGYFTAHHADLAQTIANQAAITMINAQLYEHAQTLAKLQERQRLAQELHDAVNQSLFSAGLIAEVLPRLWEQNPAEGRRSLEDLRRLTHGALAEMRGLLVELRPAIMTGADFDELLRQLGNALTGRVNIPVSVSVSGQGVLPADVQVALYRLCQEALSNIAKHAGASRVQIHLRHEPNGVEVHIVDDGRGFDPERVSLSHSGLSMMRERAKAIGAVLSIASTLGGGTAITIRWSEARESQVL